MHEIVIDQIFTRGRGCNNIYHQQYIIFYASYMYVCSTSMCLCDVASMFVIGPCICSEMLYIL
jgi:hypothetical protein